MISTEQANKMIDEKMAREAAPAQPEPNVQPEPNSSTPEPKEEPKEEVKEEPKGEEPKAEPEPKEEPKEEPKVENPEKDDKEKSGKNTPPRKKYSHEERVAHAFSIEKQKRKAQHEKDRARIKELEEELSKYKGLKLGDFDNNTENYVNYRLHEQAVENEVKATKERVEREEAEEAERENERRVNASFATEEERDDYKELLRTNGPQFYEALQAHDPNGVVLDYLNSVEKYPIVLRELMTNMESLGKVFRDKDPTMLRINLANFTQELLSGKKETPAVEPEKKVEPKPEQKPELKPLPIVGKQVANSGAPGEPVHDRAYWNNYLKTHPHG